MMQYYYIVMMHHLEYLMEAFTLSLSLVMLVLQFDELERFRLMGFEISA